MEPKKKSFLKNALTILVAVCFVAAILVVNGIIKNNSTVEQTGAKYTLIDFGSNTCPPCRELAPIIESVRDEYRDTVNVNYYDVGSSGGREKANEYGISVTPTLVFLDENGAEVLRLYGVVSEEEFAARFRSLGWIGD